jgi:GT2 family glycosyltransferase
MELLSILIACHNRAFHTERVLRQISSFATDYFQVEIIVVNDGSSDSTAEKVEKFRLSQEHLIPVKVIEGSGNWYWSKSMAIAEANVSVDSSAVLWLNDDVDLATDSFSRLLDCIELNPNSILVGQCFDHIRGVPSFGGFKNESKNPLKLLRVTADQAPIKIDTFCGNFVYIPKLIRSKVGSIDGKFQHGLGDLDYGYRVKKMGLTSLSIPGFVGMCSKDPLPKLDRRIEMLTYWNSTKKSPIKSQVHFLRKHGGSLWLLWLIAPYLRILVLGSQADLS